MIPLYIHRLTAHSCRKKEEKKKGIYGCYVTSMNQEMFC